MATLGSPEINVTFKKAATATAEASSRGRIGMVLTDATAETAQVYAIRKREDIPAGLSDENKAHINRALTGNSYAPRSITAYVGSDLAAGLEAMRAQRFDWLVGPADCTEEQAGTIDTWIKARWTDGERPRAVLPNKAAAHPGIVNLASDSFVTEDGTLTAAQFAARVAGMICGTAPGEAITCAELPEVTSVTAKTKAERNTAVAAGKLIAFHDGEKVKLDRGVTSLVTATADFPEAFKKIRLVNIICTVQNELQRLIEDNYIGKFSNTYLNKCVLLAAINSYLKGLAGEGMIENTSSAAIDTEAQRAWLTENGTDAADMTEEQIKTANTGSKVFIKCAIALLDSVEDVNISIEY